jgi:hypothetical protein
VTPDPETRQKAQRCERGSDLRVNRCFSSSAKLLYCRINDPAWIIWQSISVGFSRASPTENVKLDQI